MFGRRASVVGFSSLFTEMHARRTFCHSHSNDPRKWTRHSSLVASLLKCTIRLSPEELGIALQSHVNSKTFLLIRVLIVNSLKRQRLTELDLRSLKDL